MTRDTCLVRQLEDFQSGKDVKILGLSAGATDDDRQSALEAGMRGYLIKPVTMETLEKLISKIAD